MDYKLIYDRLCSNAKSQNRIKGKGVYYEAHHIMPECMGGDGLVSQYKWHSNIVLLTDKEHFLAHRLLCKIYPDNNDLRFAWWAMCNQEAPNQKRVFRPSARAYSEAKNLFIESFSGPNHPLYGKGYLQAGEKNPAYGKPQSEELRARKRVASTKAWSDPKKREEQSNRSKGRKKSEETKEKMRQPKSEEHKRKLREHLQSIPPASQETKNKISQTLLSKPKYECPSCGRIIGGIGNFNRHKKVQHNI
jgi:hypothetical protein